MSSMFAWVRSAVIAALVVGIPSGAIAQARARHCRKETAMKRLVAVVLVSLLVAPPVSAGQKPGNPITWQKAQRLKAGTEIMLTVTDSPPTKVKLLFADDSILVTLKPTDPKLSGDVERALVRIGLDWPAMLADRGGSFVTGDVRVSKEGVFEGDRKVADLASVIQWAPRGDVVGISEPPHSHLTRNIVIVSAIAFGVWFLLATLFQE